jgi:putative membrane protein
MKTSTMWKGLLGVSAVAALFGALAAQAQTGAGEQQPSTGGQGSPADQKKMMHDQMQDQGTMHGNMSGRSGTMGRSASGGTLNKADQKILQDLAQANMAEIESAKLAQSKSENEQVKNFARQMIDDHTQALNDVQQLASAKGVKLPGELDSKHQAMENKLGSMTGEAFDRAYLTRAGVSDHQKVDKMLKLAEARATDSDLKALAAKMLPTVEQHLNSAQHLHGEKAGKRTPTTQPAGAKGGADTVR